MRSTTGTQVQIFGQVYHLRGQDDPEHVRQVAKLVDERMNAIADQMTTSDNYRIAVLAALHVADEYLRLKGEHDRYKTQVAARSSRLVSLLDNLEARRSETSAAAGG
jgi:cell division protein ZapA